MIEFKHDIPTEQTMIFESIFEEELRMELTDKDELLAKCDCTYLYVDGEIAGEIYTIPIDILKQEGMGDGDDKKIIEDISPYFGQTAYYYSTSLLPKFRGMGLSKIFKAYHNGYLKGLGYNKVTGHSTSDGILRVNEFFGAKNIRTHKNWFDTNRDATFYEITL